MAFYDRFDDRQPQAGAFHIIWAVRGAEEFLEDTILFWTTEFGRMPCSQGSKGRDHNPFGFTMWLAGGGVQRAGGAGWPVELAGQTPQAA